MVELDLKYFYIWTKNMSISYKKWDKLDTDRLECIRVDGRKEIYIDPYLPNIVVIKEAYRYDNVIVIDLNDAKQGTFVVTFKDSSHNDIMIGGDVYKILDELNKRSIDAIESICEIVKD